jgi:BASS family bile acid:Na+ symporter
MEILRQILPLLISASLGLMVLAIALDATLGNLLFLLRRPALLLRAFLAISVAVPCAAIAAALLLPLHPAAKAGVVLMAISPVPPLAPGKQLKLGGRKEYVYGLYVAFALLAIVVVPLTIAIIAAAFGKDISISVNAVARNVLISVAAPLLIGMALKAWAPRLAARIQPWLAKLSTFLLFAAVIPVLIRAWPAMAAAVGDGTILACVLIVAAALLAGHLLGGADPRDRTTLAVAAATRHPGLALMMAAANFQDRQVSAVILVFLLTGLVVVAVYQQLLRRLGRAETASPAHPA